MARGYLGVGTEDMTPEKARALGIPFEPGALVNVVNPGSPAAAVGLRSNDIIIDVAGRRIESSVGLQQVVQSRAPKETVEVGLFARRTAMLVKVVLEENPALPAARARLAARAAVPDPKRGDGGIPGLKVTSIDRRSPASGYLQPGDVITVW